MPDPGVREMGRTDLPPLIACTDDKVAAYTLQQRRRSNLPHRLKPVLLIGVAADGYPAGSVTEMKI